MDRSIEEGAGSGDHGRICQGGRRPRGASEVRCISPHPLSLVSFCSVGGGSDLVVEEDNDGGRSGVLRWSLDVVKRGGAAARGRGGSIEHGARRV